jgi:hypothetical protein
VKIVTVGQTVHIPVPLWDRITELLGDNLVAWEGEEESVQEEHEDLIESLQDLDEAIHRALVEGRKVGPSPADDRCG